MKMAIFYLTCIVLMIVPPIFVYHKVYKDGVVGRIALLGLSLVALLFLLDRLDPKGGSYDLSALTVSGFVLFTTFLVWHLIRFHRRVVLAKKSLPCEGDRRLNVDRRYHGSTS